MYAWHFVWILSEFCLNSDKFRQYLVLRSKHKDFQYKTMIWVGLEFIIIPAALLLVTCFLMKSYRFPWKIKSFLYAWHFVWILSEFRQIQTISGFWKKTQRFSIENKDVGRFEIYYNCSGASNNHSYFSLDHTEIPWKSIISAGLAHCLNSVWILSEFRQIQTISSFRKKTQGFPL